MRTFNYIQISEKLLTPEIVQTLCRIHEYKGRQKIQHKSAADKLHLYPRTVAVQSAEAYSRFEGIDISGKNLEKLIKGSLKPAGRTDEEILGYLSALAYVFKNYNIEKMNTNAIIQVYRRMDPDARGEIKVRPWSRPELVFISNLDALRHLELLCDSFNRAWDEDIVDRLILISMFVLDFLNIQPFEHGSEKMARLLLQMLLLRAGYIAVKYVSLDAQIEASRRTYFNVQRISSNGWMNESNDYMQFVVYILSTIVQTYTQFELLIQQLSSKKISKPDRVKALFEGRTEPLAKREILAQCPDISKITVERALNDMLKSGYLRKTGAGPATAYVIK